MILFTIEEFDSGQNYNVCHPCGENFDFKDRTKDRNCRNVIERCHFI